MTETRRIIETKRNYWLLLTILHFVVMFFLREGMISEVTRLYNEQIEAGIKWDLEYGKDPGLDKNSSVYFQYRIEITKTILIFYIYMAISFLIILTYSIYLTKDLIEERVFLLLFLIFCLVIFIIYFAKDGKLNYHNYLDGQFTLVFYCLFLPYLYFITKFLIIGVRVDNTEDYLENNTNEFLTNEMKLNELKNSDILSPDEYNKKRDEILIKKIRKEFYLSENYHKLLDLKTSGILTNDEFNNKVEEIINNKMKEV